MKLESYLSMVMVTLLSGCTSTAVQPSNPVTSNASSSMDQPETIRIASMKGPTSMGLVKLYHDIDSETVDLNYTYTIEGAADAITAALVQGNVDIAALPANVASVVYNNSGGDIKVIALNTLGVLSIVSVGGVVETMEDLNGQTIVASGKDSTPQYALEYLLDQYGLTIGEDVFVEWKSEQSEVVASLASGQYTIAMLPQPFVTSALNQIDGLTIDIDLTDAWDQLNNDSTMVTGVMVARSEFIEQYPDIIEQFLIDYDHSVDYVNNHVDEASTWIEGYDIVNASIAAKAIPYCHMVCITKSEMKDVLSGYLSVLYDANPQSIGGNLPQDDFYYGA